MNPKFRAWHKEYKIMFEVSGIYWFQDTYNITCDSVDDDFEFDEKEIKLMQWTGQQDKNGKDIYEGDIITLVYSGVVYTGSVEWDSSTASFRDCYFDEYLEKEKDILDIEYYKHCIIIGNIYENSELLTTLS